MKDNDTVFLSQPARFGAIPAAMSAFLKQYAQSGKTVALITTLVAANPFGLFEKISSLATSSGGNGAGTQAAPRSTSTEASSPIS